MSAEAQAIDVIVVGAGLAGLTAAQHIIKAGYSCVVLEARDRVGGRSWSRKSARGEGIFDVGAAWINDTNQSRMFELAQAFGAEFIEQNTTGHVVLEDTDHTLKVFPYGELPCYSEDVKSHLAHIRDTVERDCQSLSVNSTSDPRSTELDLLTFLTYLQQLGASDKAIATATIWTRAMLGQDPSNISALFFLHYCKSGGGLMQMRSDRKHGGQYLRIRQGTQMVSINLAKSLPADTIHFNCPISSIHQARSDSVLVSSSVAGGPTFRAKKVLCAIPPLVLKTVNFTPPLPESKQLLLRSFHYGYYQKVQMAFKTPFWTSLGSCGLTQSFSGPACVMRDTSVPADNRFVLTCFVAGSAGLAWSQLPTHEDRQEAVLKQIATIFDDDALVREQFVQLVGWQWNDEQWSGYGCPAASLPPGVLSTLGKDGEGLRASFGDVHFAGTETSDVWAGYMEGAVRSGDREAAKIISALQTS